MKIAGAFIIWILIMLVLSFIDTAMADDPHGGTNQQGTPTIASSSQALALAFSEINPTLLSDKWQIGAGIGDHEYVTAFAIGIAKRINKKTLLSGKIGKQNGSTGKSAGLNIKLDF